MFSICSFLHMYFNLTSKALEKFEFTISLYKLAMALHTHRTKTGKHSTGPEVPVDIIKNIGTVLVSLTICSYY